MTKKQQAHSRQTDSVDRLDVDSALLALLIAAMNANDHVSPEEGAPCAQQYLVDATISAQVR